MRLAIEVMPLGGTDWKRVETTEENPYFPDALHRTYKALVDTGAEEAALIWLPENQKVAVFQRSDSPSDTYERYQEACTTYGRYKKIYPGTPVSG